MGENEIVKGKKERLQDGCDDPTDLIRRAEHSNCAGTGDILKLLPNPELNLELVDEFIAQAEAEVVGAEISGEVTATWEEEEPKALPEEPEIELEPLLNLDHIAVDDPVKMYLKEIGRVPLLSASEEVELAKLVEQGELAEIRHAQAEPVWYEAIGPGSIRRLSRMPQKIDLSTEEREKLIRSVELGEMARRRLIEANLRLVVSIAKRYIGRGMSFLDLIQEGNIGLIRAVEKFDHHKGFKFSTYATWWIRQAIARSISDQARTIRIPVHMAETINRLVRTSRRLLQDLGRDPSAEEIAEEMGIPAEKVREITKVSQEPVSLETPIGEEEDSHLSDFVEDNRSPGPPEVVSYELLREQVDDVLDSLTNRERRILQLRYGLEDGRSRTLEEVGREFGVTRERIRQIEAKALRKLRHPSQSRKLRDYLE